MKKIGSAIEMISMKIDMINSSDVRKTVVVFIAFFAILTRLYAQNDVSITTKAPNTVVLGDQIVVSYSSDSQTMKSVSDFPEVKGLEFLFGPSISRAYESHIVNGNQVNKSSITYTYMLLANDEGTFTIPSLNFEVDGKQIKSKSVTIKVLPKDKVQDNSKEELFAISTVSSSNVYEQQAVVYTCKIYAKNLSGMSLRENVKMPEFKDLKITEVEQSDDIQWQLENYNGKNYKTKIYKQYVLFPQREGKFEIEPIVFPFSVEKVDKTGDYIERLFWGESLTRTEDIDIRTNKITLNVKPLENKPLNFTGGVGDFSIKSDISSTKVEENSAITLTLKISGVGNIGLITMPKIKLHDSFEQYDPKTESKVNRLTSSGEEGYKTIEYLFIPRTYGKYVVEPIEYVFFDIKTSTYKTLKTQPYTIEVLKSKNSKSTSNSSNYYNKREVEDISTDIKFIDTNKSLLFYNIDRKFYKSLSYWSIYLISLLLFLAFFFIRKVLSDKSNMPISGRKTANKVAIKRLKKAKSYMLKNDRHNFYDETLKALLGYVGQKLNIEASSLSRDNIEEKLSQYSVDKQTISEFISILNDCEFERFAPVDATNPMQQMYDRTSEIISKIEKYKF